MNVFISYSSKSKGIVEDLASDLEALGYRVWFDRKLSGGHEWWEEILHSIRRCNLFLFALTPESVESYPCKLEYEYAHALNKRVLPVMLADINISLLPTSLSKFQIVDYRKQDKAQAMSLSKTLRRLPPGKPLPKPLPPKPEAPLPVLARLLDQITAPYLKKDEQRLLLSKLRDAMKSEENADNVRMLLQRLQKREDLTTTTQRQITDILKGKPTTKPPTKPARAAPRLFVGHTEPIFGAAFSPDGNTILTGSVDHTARLWDTKTAKELRQLIGHTGTVWSVAYAPNGRTVFTGSGDHTARLWDTTSGEELRKFVGHTDSLWGVAYSPDGHTVLTGSFDHTARLWDVTTGKEIYCLAGHTAAVWGVAYSPDGKTIATGSWDRTARIWDAATGKQLNQFSNQASSVVSVTYSPDGHVILISYRNSVARLWDAQTGKELGQLNHVAFNVTYAPDGKTILTGSADKTARLWDAQSHRELQQFATHGDAVTSVAYSPDTSAIFTGSADKIGRLWALKPISER